MRTFGLLGLVLATLAIPLIQAAYAGNKLSAQHFGRPMMISARLMAAS